MKTLVLVLMLFLSGCASIQPVSEITPDQAEALNYLKSMKQESTPLVRIDSLQMNNASAVPRAN